MSPMRVLVLGLGALAALVGAESSVAAMSSRTGFVDEVQMESSNRSGYEDIVYIRIVGAAWTASCAEPWAYFRGSSNPQFLATALTARAKNMALTISVDDTYPTVSGICQIINMRF